MARYPGAIWRPVSGHTDGPMPEHLGAVLHVNESNGNLYNWVAGDHNMSCHFEVYKNGTIEQYLDTSQTSWCQMDGNRAYVSIESEGYHTEPYTDAQLAALVDLLAWLHTEHGIPLKLADHPGERGIGWHGMGGDAWGGHTSCPGDQRKAARHYLARHARAKLGLLTPHAAPSPPPSSPTPATPPIGTPPAGAGTSHRHTDHRHTHHDTPAPIAPNLYPWQLFTDRDGKGPIYAAAPGAWRSVDAATLRGMIRAGLTSGTARAVYRPTLRRLRRLYTGK